MRVRALRQLDVVLPGDRRKALFEGQTYELPAEAVAPALAAGGVDVLDEAARHPESLTRAELDAEAQLLGIEGTAGLPNKAAVRAAIEAARGA